MSDQSYDNGRDGVVDAAASEVYMHICAAADKWVHTLAGLRDPDSGAMEDAVRRIQTRVPDADDSLAEEKEAIVAVAMKALCTAAGNVLAAMRDTEAQDTAEDTFKVVELKFKKGSYTDKETEARCAGGFCAARNHALSLLAMYEADLEVSGNTGRNWKDEIAKTRFLARTSYEPGIILAYDRSNRPVALARYYKGRDGYVYVPMLYVSGDAGCKFHKVVRHMLESLSLMKDSPVVQGEEGRMFGLPFQMDHGDVCWEGKVEHEAAHACTCNKRLGQEYADRVEGCREGMCMPEGMDEGSHGPQDGGTEPQQADCGMDTPQGYGEERVTFRAFGAGAKRDPRKELDKKMLRGLHDITLEFSRVTCQQPSCPGLQPDHAAHEVVVVSGSTVDQESICNLRADVMHIMGKIRDTATDWKYTGFTQWKDYYTAVLAGDLSDTFVLYVDGKAAGLAIATPNEPNWMYLSLVYILPGYRGRGLGVHLVKEVAGKLGVSCIHGYVHGDNEAARRMMNGLGSVSAFSPGWVDAAIQLTPCSDSCLSRTL